ncbi:52 kDa repressor of the inhibitor of the protein kinase-like, partial [Aphis craccivora]
EKKQIDKSESESDSKFDIGLYINCSKPLTNTEKISILHNLWVPDVNYKFPAQDNGKFKRTFQLKWLNTFNWLAYSKLKEGAFCMYCVLFLHQTNVGKGSHVELGKLVTKPLIKLKDALESLKNHVNLNFHKTAMLNADNVIKIHNKEQDNVYVQLNTKKKQDILKNRSSLKPIIQTIRLCGRQQIALRGHTDSGRIEMNEPTENDGNFRCLLRFRANNGDIVLKEHLEMSDLNAMYTSPQIQNEIITIFGELIQSEIVKQISKSSFFSVLADETTDISQIEQFSVCIRYLDEESMIVRENFLAFIPVQDVTGEGLANTLLETLKNLGLNLEKMRGQGYDGAATMSGAFNGVQAIVRKKYPKALYTHCISHSLNLCLSDASTAQDIRNAFGTVSECCAFFHYSAKRTHILKEKVLEINPKTQAHKLKSLCETRWVLRHEAIMIFKELLQPIISALEQIENDSKNKESIKRAHSLLNNICNFNFLVAIYFHEIYEGVKSISVLSNVNETMPRICGRQNNRNNVPFKDIEEFYRRTIFIPYLDDLLCSLKQLFLSHKDTIKSLQYVLPSLAVDNPFSYLKPAVQFYEDDLPGYQDIIEAEFTLWQSKWKTVGPKFRPLNAIETLTNLLPVSTTTAERCFSSLRRLKTYLRNSTSESRLVGLALLSIHRDIDISDDQILDKFAN